MRVSAVAVSAAILAAITIFSAGGLSLSRPAAGHPAPSGSPPAGLTVDYPLEGSVFPPEIASPTFLFRDSSDATRWVVRVTFGDHSPEIPASISGLARSTCGLVRQMRSWT